MDVTVRAARVEDAAAVARAQAAAWREAYAGLMDPAYLAGMDVDRATERWAELLGTPADGVRAYVASYGGEVVGFASAGPSRDDERVCDLELYAVNVRPDAWGAGAGTALLSAVLEPGPCGLWVVVGNDRAIGFYERRGFVADGATQDDVRLGVTEQRMVREG
ncbi:GNAT family N-acetyltransferase [Nocardioides marmoraquaticus]